jgi:hypothetical protein
MARVRFPKRRSDNSFCIEVQLRIDSADAQRFRDEIDVWLRDWIRDNRVWIRDWSTGIQEYLHFNNEFEPGPKVLLSDSSVIRIQLEGKPTAKWWKDWLVFRILKELCARFPEILEVLTIGDCSG